MNTDAPTACGCSSFFPPAARSVLLLRPSPVLVTVPPLLQVPVSRRFDRAEDAPFVQFPPPRRSRDGGWKLCESITCIKLDSCQSLEGSARAQVDGIRR